MLKSNIEKALNQQVNAEFYSAYLYLGMSTYFESLSLPGFANWMFVQYQEEVSHALKIFHFVNERGGKAELFTIEKPLQDWSSPLNVFEASLKHEQHVTNLIDNLVDLAIKEKDHATNSFLQWFVNEQVEEEASASTIVDQLKMIDNSKNGLYLLDRELTKRTFVDETVSN